MGQNRYLLIKNDGIAAARAFGVLIRAFFGILCGINVERSKRSRRGGVFNKLRAMKRKLFRFVQCRKHNLHGRLKYEELVKKLLANIGDKKNEDDFVGGIFGFIDGIFAVIEDQARGALHIHALLFTFVLNNIL